MDILIRMNVMPDFESGSQSFEEGETKTKKIKIKIFNGIRTLNSSHRKLLP